MPYVKRDASGAVVARFANKQPGEAEEWLDDAHADLQPTSIEIQAELESAVDEHINAVARTKGYDNRITCAVRAGYVNPWQAEGIAFGAWMDSCYSHCYQVISEVQAGIRVIPTANELIAEFPLMVWP